MDFFGLKMGRRCTAGGFAVIPEQARIYDPFKGFLLSKVCCFWALDDTVSHDGIMYTAGGFAVIPEQARHN